MSRPGSRPADDGFTLIEVVVAMAVFGLLAGSVLTVLVSTLHLGADNRRRSVAAGLAAQQVEAIRTLRGVDIPDGGSTTTQAVGGTSYTIARTASYVASGAATSVCAGSGDALAHKLVTVTVTWPGMGTTRPVRADTLRALGVGSDGLDATKGIIAVTVRGASGAPVPGTPVTLSPGAATTTTGSDGCAVFTGLDLATVYGASVDRTGYVGQSGARSVSTGTLSVSAAQVTRSVLSVDGAQQAAVAYTPPPGYAVPAGLSLVLRSTWATQVVPSCTSSPASTCATGIPGTLQDLYPATYDAWSGTCADARPSSPAQLAVASGSTSAGSLSVPLAGVAATVGAPGGPPVAGTTVYAVHVADSTGTTGTTCPSGERVTLGTSGASPLRVALPYGTWTITTSSSTPSTGDPKVALTPSSPTATAQVAG